MNCGAPPALEDAVLETMSAAVVTRTPLVSVPVRVPTFVMKEPLLWNVPLTLPALTVKMKSREVLPGRVTPLKFQVIVPVEFAEGDEVMLPPFRNAAFAAVLWYEKPVGRLSVSDEIETAVADVLLIVSLYVTEPPAGVVEIPGG